MPKAPPQINCEADAAGDSADDEFNGVSYPFAAKAKSVQLLYLMPRARSLKDIILHASALVLAPDNHLELVNKAERKLTRIPMEDAIRKRAVKMDCIDMAVTCFQQTLQGGALMLALFSIRWWLHSSGAIRLI